MKKTCLAQAIKAQTGSRRKAPLSLNIGFRWKEPRTPELDWTIWRKKFSSDWDSNSKPFSTYHTGSTNMRTVIKLVQNIRV